MPRRYASEPPLNIKSTLHKPGVLKMIRHPKWYGRWAAAGFVQRTEVHPVKQFSKSVWLLVLASWMSLGCIGCSKTEQPEAGDEVAAANTGEQDNAKPTLDDLHPEVIIETTLGAITLRLHAEKAPLTVQNFLAYVRSGHYDKTIFHPVEPGHVILGGGRTDDLTPKPQMMAIRNEADNGLTNRRGTVAMFRNPAVIDSATCEFFINLNDNPHFDCKAAGETRFARAADDITPIRPEDYGFCVFGEVIEGMDVLERMAGTPVTSTDEFHSIPVEPIAIRAARRIR